VTTQIEDPAFRLGDPMTLPALLDWKPRTELRSAPQRAIDSGRRGKALRIAKH
jgi:hypothetical protein